MRMEFPQRAFNGGSERVLDHQGWNEHRAIVAALRKGETDLAVKLLETHIQESRDRLLEILQHSRRSSRARGVTVILDLIISVGALRSTAD